MKLSGFLCVTARTCVTLALLAGISGWAAPPPVKGQTGRAPAIEEQPAAEPPPAPPPEHVVAVALAHRAERLKKAFLSRDEIAIQGAMLEVDQMCRTYGTLDMLPLVEGMTLWARSLGNAGQTDLGLTVIQNIERWAPRHPTLLSTRVILMRQQGLKGYLWSMADVLVLNRLRWDHPVHRWLWMVQHFAWLRFMATVLLWGWTATLALRYRRVFRNLWEEPLAAKGANPTLVAVFGAMVLALPVLLGFDPSLAAFCWLWLLVPFLARIEFRLSVAIILLQLAHPALAVMEPKAGQEVRPSVVDLQLQPHFKRSDALGAKYLPEADRVFLQGWQQLQAQDWPAAETTFQDLLAGHKRSDLQQVRAEVLNNIGVAQFQQGNIEAASLSFQEAFKLAPGRAEILANQSIIAFGNLDPVLGVGKQAEARQQDPLNFDRLMQVLKAARTPKTFAMPLPDSPARSSALATALVTPEENQLLKLPPLAGIVLSALLPALAAILLLARLNWSVRQAHPTQCMRCGEPFHTTDSPEPSVCSKCHHLFILKDGLHGESRLRKLDEVADFQTSQRWIHRGLIVLLPGLDLVFIGKARQGFVEFGFLTFALGLVIATGRSVRYPGEILADPSSTWLPIGVVLLLVLFMRSWLKLMPPRS